MADNRKRIEGKNPGLDLIETGGGRASLEIRNGIIYIVDQKNNQDIFKYTDNSWYGWNGVEWVELGSGSSSGDGETDELIYDFTSAQETWTINHDLNRHPAVLVEVGGEFIQTEINYPDSNTVEIKFNEPQTGKAHLNY